MRRIKGIIRAGLVVLTVVSARAVDTIWDSAYDGSSWHTPAAWPSGIPSASDKAYVPDSPTANGPHIGPGVNAVASNLTVGVWGTSNHTGYVFVEGGSLSVRQHVSLGGGTAPGTAGHFSMSSGNVNVGGHFFTGQNSGGDAVVSGGSIMITNWLVLGQAAAARGVFHLDGGIVSANVLGINGNSTLDISEGTLYIRGLSPANIQTNFIDTGKITAYGGKSVLLVEPYGTYGSKVTASKTLRFWNSDLPAQQYIQVHSEVRADAGSPWQAKNNWYAPFKSKVDLDLRQAYWRKDSLPNSFYGELFTFGQTYIRLHAETFPAKQGIDDPNQPAWDPRYDRFRLFVEYGQPDWRLGRVMMPVGSYDGWVLEDYLDTYLCNSFSELNNGTVPIFQPHFHDVRVTVERRVPYSTVGDGECAGWPADAGFKQFDEALMIVQEMELNRERFIFARKGSVHYGIVRWDNSIRDTYGNWVVVQRAVGLNIGIRPKGLSFGGFHKRARADRYMDSRPKDIVDDINGDGCADFMTIGSDGTIRAGLGREDDWTSSTAFSVGNPWAGVFNSQQRENKPLGVGDMNGDGFSDYVFIGTNGAIWAGLGSTNGVTGTMAISNPWGSAFTSKSTWNKPLGVGDINGDGFADYVFINGKGGIAVGKGRANGVATSMTITNALGGSIFNSQQSMIKPLGVGDINGDSFSDIVTINDVGEINVIYSNGDRTTYAGSLSNACPGFTSTSRTIKPLFVGDANGDEYADIVVIDSAGQITAMLTDGKDVFATVPVGNPWSGSFKSQSTGTVSMQQPFGWGWWFTVDSELESGLFFSILGK